MPLTATPSIRIRSRRLAGSSDSLLCPGPTQGRCGPSLMIAVNAGMFGIRRGRRLRGGRDRRSPRVMKIKDRPRAACERLTLLEPGERPSSRLVRTVSSPLSSNMVDDAPARCSFEALAAVGHRPTEPRMPWRRSHQELVWRETTPGSGLLGSLTNEPPVIDRAHGHGRREPDKPKRASLRGPSYMAARVLRGISVGRT